MHQTAKDHRRYKRQVRTSMKTGTLKKCFHANQVLFLILNSTESGFGSDIFDVNATDTGRHSSTTERVRHRSVFSTYLMVCVSLFRHCLNEMQTPMKKQATILCLIIEVDMYLERNLITWPLSALIYFLSIDTSIVY